MTTHQLAKLLLEGKDLPVKPFTLSEREDIKEVESFLDYHFSDNPTFTPDNDVTEMIVVVGKR